MIYFGVYECMYEYLNKYQMVFFVFKSTTEYVNFRFNLIMT